MAGLTDSAEVSVLNRIVNQSLWLGVSVPPVSDDAGTGFSEPVGSGYSRPSIVSANWGTPAAGSVANNAAITFPDATSAWGSLTAFALFDANTAGNMVAYASCSVDISANQILQFGISSIVVTLD